MKTHIFTDSTTERNELIFAYLKDISKFKLVTYSEEKEICKNLINGKKKPRQRLVEGNLRFVISISRQYQNSGLGLMDLINEGNIGLIKASQMFDPVKGVRFKIFAFGWIRQAIMEALKEKSAKIK